VTARRLNAGWVLAAVLVAQMLTPSAGSAAAECAESPTTKIPVLFVHGYTGSPQSWEEPPLALTKTLARNEGLLIRTFDYEPINLRWVTNPGIGPALASEIECLASASRLGGGPGKVVLVTHSMGGLAARFAVAQEGVAALVGLVVTIGTPHDGSALASFLLGGTVQSMVIQLFGRLLSALCHAGNVPDTLDASPCPLIDRAGSEASRALRLGSTELEQLPAFPEELPVLAVGGNIELSTSVFGHRIGLGSIGDVFVEEASASRFGRGEDMGGGIEILRCDAALDLLFVGAAGVLTESANRCSHGPLIHDAGVAQILLEHVGRWVGSNLLTAETAVRPDGFGPVTVGMTFAEASAALAGNLEDDSFSPDCSFADTTIGPPRVSFMVLDGQIARTDVWVAYDVEPGSDLPTPRTLEGVGVDSTEEEVLAAYPDAEVRPPPYGGDGHEITVHSADPEFGYVFETSGGFVSHYRAGRFPAVSFIEGCA
jgi:pimeloyl-ACP methyl ester carboxylesterase